MQASGQFPTLKSAYARATRIWRKVAKTRDPGSFLSVFALCSAVGLFAIAGGHLALAKAKLLPAPTYVANWCIDEKLDYLAQQNLSDVELVAVGSSATWRNLDMTILQHGLGLRALNAAPCYLHVDQTAFLTEFLLDRMPRAKALVTILFPRDFERCDPREREIFDPRLTGAVLDRKLPRWLPYVTGFRPIYLLTQAKMRRDGNTDISQRNVSDGLGSLTPMDTYDWQPPLQISDACYADLTVLDQVTAAHGVDLVVVSSPMNPIWKSKQDPDGHALDEWRRRIRASVSDRVLVINGDELNLRADQFADAMHLRHPNERILSEMILKKMRSGACEKGRRPSECLKT